MSKGPHMRRKVYQTRKLELLTLFRDSLERRLASVIAAINTLETQIQRDEKSDNSLSE